MWIKRKRYNEMVEKIDALTTVAYQMKKYVPKTKQGIMKGIELTDKGFTNSILNQMNTILNDAPSTPGIYIVKDGDEYMYIGQSSNIKRRMTQHFKNQTTWSKVDVLIRENPLRYTYEYVKVSVDELNSKEVELITKHKPKYNFHTRIVNRNVKHKSTKESTVSPKGKEVIIKSFDELKGKEIAVTGKFSVTRYQLANILKEHGVFLSPSRNALIVDYWLVGTEPGNNKIKNIEEDDFVITRQTIDELIKGEQ